MIFECNLAQRIIEVLYVCPVTVDKLPILIEAYINTQYEAKYLNQIINRGMGELWDRSYPDYKLYALV